MKGAIGNAFLLNIVITFMLIFFSLLIGGMAFTKAYKVKNHIVNSINEYINKSNKSLSQSYNASRGYDAEWNGIVDPYLGKVGYHLKSANSCPSKDNYTVIGKGDYDYCLYYKKNVFEFGYKERYLVLAYMKLDLPVIGDSIKIPITGETKTYVFYEP